MRDDVDVVRRPGQPDHEADGNHVDDVTRASERTGPLAETGKEGAMPGKRPSVKNEKQYEALKEKGMSKERAARIANSPGASSRGGKKSHSKSRSGSSKQGGTTAEEGSRAKGREGHRKEVHMKREQADELLYQALETEQGGVQVYEAAVRCATTPELRKEWEGYLDETRNHERILLRVFGELGLDPAKETPGRLVLRLIGQGLIKAMEMARANDPVSAQLVAAECVVQAETKDHMNWELIGLLAKEFKGSERKALEDAHGEVEDQEDEHLYHTMGWARELWIDSLGMPAVLPPPEEAKDVKTAIGAARAKNARTEML
jgi:hypothetical protein